MENWQAIILGIIQGLTEFLPVSSSGHLELANEILGADTLPEESMLFIVVLHAATALSTLVVFRKDIAQILAGLFQFQDNEAFRFSLNIVLSMIPAAAVGVLLDEQIESFFGGQILFIGFMLLITAVLLLLADKAKHTDKKVGIKHAFLIGVAQAIAILPGISRSGATISTSVLLGIDREKAARFSFIMVLPLILGKMAKDILDGAFSETTGTLSVYVLGFSAAFITGIIACTWMIKLVKNSQLKYFALYCAIVGTIAIVFALI